MIRWEQCKKDFEPDGRLRDIYITPATLDDWRAIYSFLREDNESEYSVDGIIQPFPETVDQAFEVRSAASPSLSVRVARGVAVFHFFTEDEIECDIFPGDITSQSDLDALLGFIRQLGDTTGKPVNLTPENESAYPFIIYDPAIKHFRYVGSTSFLSPKQEIYSEMLRLVLVQNRNVSSQSWWKRRKDRSMYYETELVHNLYASLFEREFVEHDIWFLNAQARDYCENCNSTISGIYTLQTKLIQELIQLVPERLRCKLKWPGPHATTENKD